MIKIAIFCFLNNSRLYLLSIATAPLVEVLTVSPLNFHTPPK